MSLTENGATLARYNALVNRACEALLADEGYALMYYEGDAGYLDVLDVFPQHDEVGEVVYNEFHEAIALRMRNITGIVFARAPGLEDALPQRIAPYIGWRN